MGLPPGTPVHASRSAEHRIVSNDERDDAMARARVWRAPATASEGGQLQSEAGPVDLSCRFRLARPSGTTPKFDCVLATGEIVRVKYGRGAEIPAEAAATRLLRTLGFAADDITLVQHLRCYGCPFEPFTTAKIVAWTATEARYARGVNYDAYHDFTWVAVERKYDAPAIETATTRGWAMPELDRVDPSKGGAPRAQIDALRLLAVFLAHWDNKAANQRLVCGSPVWPEGRPCPEPIVMLQDVGATFGPRKVSLRGWSAAPIWADRGTCLATMRHMPYSGATFMDVRVSEEGRQFASRLLTALSDTQIAQLFADARFDRPRGMFSDKHPVDAWADVFRSRVRMISEGPACPPL